MKPKPRLSFWQIWNMSFGFLGIQFGFALQNANASRILQTFGADVHHLSWFWLVAPITGFQFRPAVARPPAVPLAAVTLVGAAGRAVTVTEAVGPTAVELPAPLKATTW